MIVFLSDFQNSEYAGIVKGVIARILRKENKKPEIIDLTHGIERFNIKQAAYVLYSAHKFFPHGSVFLGVVDPGVGTERKGIVLRSDEYYFIGPNNGIFSLIDFKHAYEINENKVAELSGLGVSTTFHARDIFAPVACFVELHIPMERFSDEISVDKVVKIISEPVIKKEGGMHIIEGEIIACDAFGNIITNIKARNIKKFAEFGKIIDLQINEKLKLRFLPSYGYAKKGEVLCLINSAEHFEIACREGSAKDMLKIKGEEKIIITFEK